MTSGLPKPRLPFPFGERDPEADKRLFGDRRPDLHFEHFASELEAQDDGHDSGIGRSSQLFIKLLQIFYLHKYITVIKDLKQILYFFQTRRMLPPPSHPEVWPLFPLLRTRGSPSHWSSGALAATRTPAPPSTGRSPSAGATPARRTRRMTSS